jgi:hypothetical protein
MKSIVLSKYFSLVIPHLMRDPDPCFRGNNKKYFDRKILQTVILSLVFILRAKRSVIDLPAGRQGSSR